MTSRGSRHKKDIIYFIKKFTDTYGYPPTLKEIANDVGLKSSSSIHYYVKDLIKEGKLMDMKSFVTACRSLKVTENKELIPISTEELKTMGYYLKEEEGD